MVGSGSIAFASRQFAIMDVGNVRIGQLAGGTVISAQEESRINGTSSVVLYGSVGSDMTDMLLRNSTGELVIFSRQTMRQCMAHAGFEQVYSQSERQSNDAALVILLLLMS